MRVAFIIAAVLGICSQSCGQTAAVRAHNAQRELGLGEADAAVFRAQVGEVKQNSFTARYLKPGQTYRFEVEPIDFAQNRGPRCRLDVVVPPIEPATEDALVRAWAERILARAATGPAEHRRDCAAALTDWLEHKHRSRPWAADLLRRCKELKPNTSTYRKRSP